jgi:hypothetical protein
MAITAAIKSAWKKTLDQYGTYTFWATIAAVVVLFLIRHYPSSFWQRWGDSVSYWLTLIPILLFAVAFIFNLGWFHFSSSVPRLEIEFVNPVEPDGLLHRWPLRIRVAHTHPTETIKNVRVLVTNIECPQWAENRFRDWLLKNIKFPFYLPEAGNTDYTKSHDLAPKPYAKMFDVFAVRMNLAESQLLVAPFEPPDLRRRDFWSKNELSVTSDNSPTGNCRFIVTFQVTADGSATIQKSAALDVGAHILKRLPGKQIDFLDPPPPHWTPSLATKPIDSNQSL